MVGTNPGPREWKAFPVLAPGSHPPRQPGTAVTQRPAAPGEPPARGLPSSPGWGPGRPGAPLPPATVKRLCKPVEITKSLGRETAWWRPGPGDAGGQREKPGAVRWGGLHHAARLPRSRLRPTPCPAPRHRAPTAGSPLKGPPGPTEQRAPHPALNPTHLLRPVSSLPTPLLPPRGCGAPRVGGKAFGKSRERPHCQELRQHSEGPQQDLPISWVGCPCPRGWISVGGGWTHTCP